MTVPDRIVRAITAAVARMQVRTKHGDECDPIVVMHPALYPKVTKVGSVPIVRSRFVSILAIYVLNRGTIKITAYPFEYERVETIDRQFSTWRITSPMFIRSTSPSYVLTGV